MAIVNAVVSDNIKTLAASKDAQAAKSKSEQAKNSLLGTYEQFLKMLTVQLQNQDPTDPMKSEQFTAQIAALSTVEQQVNTNKNLEQLIALMGGGQLNTLVGYIGKQVEAEGNVTVLDGQQPAMMTYTLDRPAQSVEVTIQDSTGKVVFSGEGLKTAGKNTVYWDGKNSFTGETLAPGTYKFKVSAKDIGGKDIAATTYTSGVVSSADLENGKGMLSIGTIQIPVEKLLSVKKA